jgi:hypothetical protein
MIEALLLFHAHHAFFLVVVAITAYSLWKSIGKDSPRRRLHGKYVMVWAVAGFVSGGVIYPYIWHGELGGEGAMAGCMFLLLFGWLIGMVHGGLALLWMRPSND